MSSAMVERTVVIHQPDFLPHLGFFDKFLDADIWVVLDTVQFLSGGSKSWHNRDKIKTRNGAAWITVAVQKCPLKTAINDVLLATTVDWRQNNLNLIKANYRLAPFFSEVYPHVQELYRSDCVKLADFNLRSIRMLMDLLDIRIETVMASTLDPQGSKNELLIDIVKKVRGTVYLSGTGARDYLQTELFEREGIGVIWQEFRHPRYPQLHGDFIPHLSSIDVLFNCGITKSREILREHR